jgi:hypothetical protein
MDKIKVFLDSCHDVIFRSFFSEETYLIDVNTEDFNTFVKYAYRLFVKQNNSYRYCKDCNIFLSRHYASAHEKLKETSTHSLITAVEILGKYILLLIFRSTTNNTSLEEKLVKIKKFFIDNGKKENELIILPTVTNAGNEKTLKQLFHDIVLLDVAEDNNSKTNEIVKKMSI